MFLIKSKNKLQNILLIIIVILYNIMSKLSQSVHLKLHSLKETSFKDTDLQNSFDETVLTSL